MILTPVETANLQGSSTGHIVGLALRFDLSSLDQDVNIDWAGLTIGSVLDTSVTERVMFEVRPAAVGWRGGERYTLDQLPRVIMPPVTREYEHNSTKALLDVTEFVDLWLVDTVANYGVIVTVYDNLDESLALKTSTQNFEAVLEVFFSK